MPRRQFVADLAKAQQDVLPLGITSLKAGEDDGQLQFSFVGGQDGLASGPVDITALIPELSEYPKSHDYMVFSSDSAPRHIADALENIAARGLAARKTVFELLDIVSATLLRISHDRDGEDEFAEEDEDDVDIYDSDHEDFTISAPAHNAAYAAQAPPAGATKTRTSDWPFRKRIRADLRATKEAGFKVGVLGHLLDGYNCYVTISIRISRLGISEEAMQAWQVESADYLILIIQYPNGYKTNEELQGYDSIRLVPNIGMRIVTGKRYKPSLQEAIRAFTVVRHGDRASGAAGNDLPGPEDVVSQDSSVRDTFISRPLATLLQERLVPILRYRSAGMGWFGAEEWYRHQTNTGLGSTNADAVPDEFYKPEPPNDALPDVVVADHYLQKVTQYSFPLLAMQFLLRHFVRCTEFCLVCHSKLDSDIEAIKPYVCENPLCLYQYMTLGFGPSIEYELLAQPYVVDLLISFCYNSCAARRLKEFPDGLSIRVPAVDTDAYNVLDPAGQAGRYGYRQPNLSAQKTQARSVPPVKHEVGFDMSRKEIIFYNPSVGGCPVRRFEWIVINTDAMEGYDLHCRVIETTFYPTIMVGAPIRIRQQRHRADQVGGNLETPATTRPVSPVSTAPTYVPATFQIYEVDFGDLDGEGKSLAMCRLLDTLPNVFQMRDYLLSQRPSELKNWSERISSSALSLLRWIVASNRACIMQVDGEKQTNQDDNKVAKSSGSTLRKDEERCYGMYNYMQFRFAMGAPDKEQRFITQVRDTTSRLSLQYPTMFAWHGSPLFNWHGIIREGLHYKNVDHGRAYGDGVYFAKDAATSTGYSGMYGGYSAPGSNTFKQGTWPNSVLRATSALALNEIVNAPQEFQSPGTPYYVVKQLDWIQTRYLFVQVAPTSETVEIGAEAKPQNPHPQDPKHTPKGISGNLEIPTSAIKSGKTARGVTKGSVKSLNPFKKLKLSKGGTDEPVVISDEVVESDATDTEDLEILFDEPEPEAQSGKSMPIVEKRKQPKGATTDFVPGLLDFSTLPLMPLPTYATPGTTKRLLQELKTLSKVQETSNLAELGWYIDVEKIENLYQWIVELHSFHTFEVKGKPLPLAEDMKKQDIKSVVLEIRFNKDFPFSPPYVRVIRPRFLTFNQGGGGHIVMGGAMCMELLTNTGWSSVSSMESVLMQIRMAIASEPFARLDRGSRAHDYGTSEAAEGYMRACATHGWQVPPGFKEMAYGQPSSSRELLD